MGAVRLNMSNLARKMTPKESHFPKDTPQKTQALLVSQKNPTNFQRTGNHMLSKLFRAKKKLPKYFLQSQLNTDTTT